VTWSRNTRAAFSRIMDIAVEYAGIGVTSMMAS